MHSHDNLTYTHTRRANGSPVLQHNCRKQPNLRFYPLETTAFLLCLPGQLSSRLQEQTFTSPLFLTKNSDQDPGMHVSHVVSKLQDTITHRSLINYESFSHTYAQHRAATTPTPTPTPGGHQVHARSQLSWLSKVSSRVPRERGGPADCRRQEVILYKPRKVYSHHGCGCHS